MCYKQHHNGIEKLNTNFNKAQSQKIAPLVHPIAKVRASKMVSIHQEIIKQTSSESFPFFHKRLHAKDSNDLPRPSIRGFYIVQMHEYINWNIAGPRTKLPRNLILKIAAVGEYCITLMYLDNHYYDGKYGVITEAARKQNREERAALKKALDTFVEESFEEKIKELVKKTIQELFYLYSIGFVLDQDFLSIEHFLDPNFKSPLDVKIRQKVHAKSYLRILNHSTRSKYPGIQQNAYFEMYLERAFLINAVFFQVFTNLLFEVYNPFHPEREMLMDYANCYGIAQQLVNDNSDFIPSSYGLDTVAKTARDSFNDLRMQLFTLPMMALAQETDKQKKYPNDIRKIFQYYASGNFNFFYYRDKQEKWILEILRENNALKYAQQIVAKFSKYIKTQLNLNELNPSTSFLLDMFSFTENNRFYHIYNQ